jgi:hypothetical protein
MGRFTPSEARSIAYFSKSEFGPMYERIFYETAKQMMWELHLLFGGELVDSEGTTHGLHSRLSAEQREHAREAFCILWAVLRRARLEPSAFAKAKVDERFGRFMARALEPIGKRGGRRGAQPPRRPPGA